MKYAIRIKKGSYTSQQLRKMWEQGSLDADAEYYDEFRLEWLPLRELMESASTLFSVEEVFVRLGESKLRGCLSVYNKEEKINIFVDGGFMLFALGGQLEGEFALNRALQLEGSSHEWIANAESPGSNLRINITAYALEHSIARDVRIGNPATQKQVTKTLGMEPRDKADLKSNFTLVSVADPSLKWPITKGTNIVGRDPSCDIIVNDLNISRKHCLLEVSGQSIKIKDLDSNNGTAINGTRIKQGTIKKEDQLSLGTCHLLLKEDKKEEKRKSSNSVPLPIDPRPVAKGIINSSGFYESIAAKQ